MQWGTSVPAVQQGVEADSLARAKDAVHVLGTHKAPFPANRIPCVTAPSGRMSRPSGQAPFLFVRRGAGRRRLLLRSRVSANSPY